MMESKKKLRQRIAYLEQVIDEARYELEGATNLVFDSALNHPCKGGEPTLGVWDGFAIFWITKLETLKKAKELLHYD